ncbi:MAG: hypothetical protein SGCHY_005554 [Lobulomycetales sp.]
MMNLLAIAVLCLCLSTEAFPTYKLKCKNKHHAQSDTLDQAIAPQIPGVDSQFDRPNSYVAPSVAAYGHPSCEPTSTSTTETTSTSDTEPTSISTTYPTTTYPTTTTTTVSTTSTVSTSTTTTEPTETCPILNEQSNYLSLDITVQSSCEATESSLEPLWTCDSFDESKRLNVTSQVQGLVKGQMYNLTYTVDDHSCGDFYFSVKSANGDTVYVDDVKPEGNTVKLFYAEDEEVVVSFFSDPVAGQYPTCVPTITDMNLAAVCDCDATFNLVQNPSFETNPGCDGDKSWCFVDDYQVPNWKSTNNGVIEIDLTVWAAFEGAASTDLSPDADTIIYQALTLTPERQYTLKFALSKNPCGNGKFFFKIAPQTATVDSDVITLFPYGRYTGTNEWQEIEESFTVTEANVNLMFGSLAGSSCGPVIDDISITPSDCTLEEKQE